MPGVKSTISGKCDWTPISIKQPSLTDEFDTDYLRKCKGIGVVKIGNLLRAHIQTKSATFFTKRSLPELDDAQISSQGLIMNQ